MEPYDHFSIFRIFLLVAFLVLRLAVFRSGRCVLVVVCFGFSVLLLYRFCSFCCVRSFCSFVLLLFVSVFCLVLFCSVLFLGSVLFMVFALFSAGDSLRCLMGVALGLLLDFCLDGGWLAFQPSLMVD